MIYYCSTNDENRIGNSNCLRRIVEKLNNDVKLFINLVYKVFTNTGSLDFESEISYKQRKNCLKILSLQMEEKNNL